MYSTKILSCTRPVSTLGAFKIKASLVKENIPDASGYYRIRPRKRPCPRKSLVQSLSKFDINAPPPPKWWCVVKTSKKLQ